jgi:hypothetical protein
MMGRPKLLPEQKRSVRVVTRLTPVEKGKLDTICEQMEVSQSNFIRGMVMVVLDRRFKALTAPVEMVEE